MPVQGCTGAILSGFQSVRLPLDKKKKIQKIQKKTQKTKQKNEILTFQLSNTKQYLEVHFPCSVDLTPLSVSDGSGLSFLKYECVNSRITFTIFSFAVKV